MITGFSKFSVGFLIRCFLTNGFVYKTETINFATKNLMNSKVLPFDFLTKKLAKTEKNKPPKP